MGPEDALDDSPAHRADEHVAILGPTAAVSPTLIKP